MKNTYRLAKEVAIYEVPSRLSTINVTETYGVADVEGLYDLITGDTPYDELPQRLRDDIGNEYDLEAIATDLRVVFDTVVYSYRSLCECGYMDEVIKELENA